MKKSIFFSVLIAVSVLGALFFNRTSPVGTRTETVLAQPTIVPSRGQGVVNRKASFLVFTNGTKRLFTDMKYHDRSESVFIQADNPSIVHVKKPNVTWNDFFATMPAPMKITNDCLMTGTGQSFCTNADMKLKFYINGAEVRNGLTKEIHENDRLLVTYGAENEKEIEQQLSQIPTQEK